MQQATRTPAPETTQSSSHNIALAHVSPVPTPTLRAASFNPRKHPREEDEPDDDEHDEDNGGGGHDGGRVEVDAASSTMSVSATGGAGYLDAGVNAPRPLKKLATATTAIATTTAETDAHARPVHRRRRQRPPPPPPPPSAQAQVHYAAASPSSASASSAPPPSASASATDASAVVHAKATRSGVCKTVKLRPWGVDADVHDVDGDVDLVVRNNHNNSNNSHSHNKSAYYAGPEAPAMETQVTPAYVHHGHGHGPVSGLNALAVAAAADRQQQLTQKQSLGYSYDKNYDGQENRGEREVLHNAPPYNMDVDVGLSVKEKGSGGGAGSGSATMVMGPGKRQTQTAACLPAEQAAVAGAVSEGTYIPYQHPHAAHAPSTSTSTPTATATATATNANVIAAATVPNANANTNADAEEVTAPGTLRYRKGGSAPASAGPAPAPAPAAAAAANKNAPAPAVPVPVAANKNAPVPVPTPAPAPGFLYLSGLYNLPPPPKPRAATVSQRRPILTLSPPGHGASGAAGAVKTPTPTPTHTHFVVDSPATMESVLYNSDSNNNGNNQSNNQSNGSNQNDNNNSAGGGGGALTKSSGKKKTRATAAKGAVQKGARSASASASAPGSARASSSSVSVSPSAAYSVSPISSYAYASGSGVAAPAPATAPAAAARSSTSASASASVSPLTSTSSGAAAPAVMPQGAPPETWSGIGVDESDPHAQTRAIHYWNWRKVMVESATKGGDDNPSNFEEPEEQNSNDKNRNVNNNNRNSHNKKNNNNNRNNREDSNDDGDEDEDQDGDDEDDEDDAEAYILSDRTVIVPRDHEGCAAIRSCDRGWKKKRRSAARKEKDVGMVDEDSTTPFNANDKNGGQGHSLIGITASSIPSSSSAASQPTASTTTTTTRHVSSTRIWETEKEEEEKARFYVPPVTYSPLISRSVTSSSSLTYNPNRVYPRGKPYAQVIQAINSRNAHMSVMAPPPQVAPFNPLPPPSPSPSLSEVQVPTPSAGCHISKNPVSNSVTLPSIEQHARPYGLHDPEQGERAAAYRHHHHRTTSSELQIVEGGYERNDLREAERDQQLREHLELGHVHDRRAREQREVEAAYSGGRTHLSSPSSSPYASGSGVVVSSLAGPASAALKELPPKSVLHSFPVLGQPMDTATTMQGREWVSKKRGRLDTEEMEESQARSYANEREGGMQTRVQGFGVSLPLPLDAPPYASSSVTPPGHGGSPSIMPTLPPIRDTIGASVLTHPLIPLPNRGLPPPPSLAPPPPLPLAPLPPPTLTTPRHQIAGTSAPVVAGTRHVQVPTPWLYAGEEAEYEDDETLASAIADGTGPGEDGRLKKKRRTRVALSCAECKRRKIKCDRKQPCTPCKRRGDESNCKWAAVEAKDGTPSRAEFDALQMRLAHIEQFLHNMGPNLSTGSPIHALNHHAAAEGMTYAPTEMRRLSLTSDVAPSSAYPPAISDLSYSQAGSLSPRHRSATVQVRQSSVSQPSSHFLLPPQPYHVKNEDRSPERATATASASTSVTVPADGRPPTLKLLPEALRKNGSPGRLSGTTFPLSDADWEQMTSVALSGANKQRTEAGSMHVDVQKELEALVGTLPSKEHCDQLWAYYLERLEWQHSVIHPDTFHHMYATFWAFKTHVERAAHTPIAWFALLLIVMSHALATMRPADAIAAGIVQDVAHWRMLCNQMWIASERALALDNFSQTVSLEVIQTLILLAFRVISLHPKGWSHQSPILAMATRLGINIGLSSVGADKVGEIPAAGLYKRELCRRIWFNIVYLDWRFSIPLSQSYLITDFHSTTFPANMDWGDMVDNIPFQPKSRQTFTACSMFLARLHNSIRVRELCDALNEVTRSGVQDVSRLYYDHELAVNETITREPACIVSKDERLEAVDKRVEWARIGHTLELDYRAIQIHRSFLIADFREARARTVCVDTAEKMLASFIEGRHVGAPGVWWWYGYTAAIVLLMEQYYTDYQQLTPESSAHLNQKLDSVVAYVMYQGNHDELSPRSTDGVLILETLISEIQKRQLAIMNAISNQHGVLPLKPDAQIYPVTRMPSSSPIHSFRKWILNLLPFLKLPLIPGLPSAHPRGRDMDASFWTAIFDLEIDSHKTSRRGNFGKH